MSGAAGSKDKKKRRKANVLAAPSSAVSMKKNSKKKGGKIDKIEMKEEICSDVLDEMPLDESQHGSSEEDYSDDEDEGADGYKPGGYHPINIGDKYNNQRYTVVSKLGWGHFSTVWMVHDKRASTHNSPDFIALKIQKSAQHYTEAAIDEIELLRCVPKALAQEKVIEEFGVGYDPCVVMLLDTFTCNGPNGRHVCMTFEMLGENLLKVIKRYDYKGIPIAIVKTFVKQICVGLDFLHRHCSIIHTDLKPENILIARAPPPPSPDVVNALINSTRNQPGSSSSKKGKKKKGNNNAATIESIEKQLSSGKITGEQRKKLKKKLKKKKAIELKKEKNKRGGGVRGGDRRSDAKLGSDDKHGSDDKLGSDDKHGSGECNNSDSKEELKGSGKGSGCYDLKEEIKEEMRLMELNSFPNSYHCAEQKEHYEQAIADEKGVAEPAPKEDYEQVIADEKVVTEAAPYQWLRPTLFSYLNFSTENNPIKDTPPSPFNAVPIPAEKYCPPPNDMYARISMIVSMNKIYEIFGAPEEFISESTDESYPSPPSFVDWYLALLSTNTAELAEELTDETLQFAIRGHGDDAIDIVTSTTCCLMNDVVCRPDKFTILPTTNKMDRPLLWNIIHHASITEKLLEFLEYKIEGVKFLCHYDIGGHSIGDDDMEMLYITRRLCIHRVSNDLGGGSPTSPIGEREDDTPMYYKSGGGSLIGIDIDSMINSIAVTDDTTDSYYPHHLLDYIHPLSQRFAYFLGSSSTIDDKLLVEEVVAKLVHMQSLVSHIYDDYNGYDSCESVDEGGVEKVSTVELDAEYSNCHVKIVDLGNACWTNKHFTDDIQTRQYRAPEVILGADYDTAVDMWSLGCIVFELLTGDLLFDPHAGSTWDREEDHLAMMIELVGFFPKSVYSNGKNAGEYFNRQGELKNIRQLKFWPIREVLRDKYKVSDADALQLSEFLEPILEVNPARRATAYDCLQHKWLQEPSSSD